MCDFQKRKSLDFFCDWKKMRFIKKSRWELPIPKSTSYWNEICKNIENEVHRVKDPFSHFPFISHSNNNLYFHPHDSAKLNNLSKVQSYDEPIVKVSPPTPLRKSSFISTTDNFQDRNTLDKKHVDRDKNLILKFRYLTKSRRNNIPTERASFEKTDEDNKKVFSKKTCPYHKNEPPPQIFDDELKKFLPRRKFSAKTLLQRTSGNSQLHLKKSVSRSMSGLHSSDSSKINKKDNNILKEFESGASPEVQVESQSIQNSMNLPTEKDSEIEYNIEKKILFGTQKATKTPKLGKASLLASFAKTVSIPSSVETHESSEEDYSKSDINLYLPSVDKYDSESKSKEELRSSETTSKDYLRVPKLGYASLHPSFKKLLPVGSFPDEEEMVLNELIPRIIAEHSLDLDELKENRLDHKNLKIENSLEISSVSSSNVEETIDDDSTTSRDPKKSGTRKLVRLPKKHNYSTRYAYRALKLLTKNKNLKFFPEEQESVLEQGSSESSFSSESMEPGYKIQKSNIVRLDFTTYRNIRKKLRTVAPKYLGQDYFFSSSKTEEIKTIVSSSRSTSGSSPAFQTSHLKSNTLSRIPSIKIYPRKNSDRCLPCLYKTFKEPQKLKRELPLAVLSSIIKEPSIALSESDTSSISLPDFKSSDIEILISDGRSNLESNLESSRSLTEVMFKKVEADKSEISQDNESILSKDQSLSPKSLDLKQVSVKSGSVQSTNISKPSTPSGQSSESDDARLVVTNGTLNTSKYLAPCHAPLVWKPNLESLKALRLRKATSMQSRASAVTSKSNDDSDLEDSLIEIPNIKDIQKRDRKVPSKSISIRSPVLKIKPDKEANSEAKSDLDKSRLKEKRKMLVKTKTVAGKIDTSKAAGERKGCFVRAKTSIDLTSKIPDSRKTSVYFDQENSIEDLKIFKENLLELKEDSKNEENSFEFSEEDQEVLEILERSLEEDESPGVILKKLCDWYSKRVSELRKGDVDPDLKRTLKISLNLLRLLAESKRYLNSDKLSPDLEFSSQQPPLCNSRQLRRVLPLKSYNLVAPILNMPQWYPRKMEHKTVFAEDRTSKKQRKDRSRSSNLSSDLSVHPPSVTEPSLGDHSRNAKGLNPYARFLVKPRRKVVTWRPLNKEDLQGYNPDATLHNRATLITDKICHDFCEWLRGLSGPLERIDEEVLKDMFQIVFTSDACKSMQVFLKEMPTVPRPIALTRNSPSATELEMTRKELMRDIEIEKKPKKTFAFGTALPKKLRFIPPQNQVESKWFLCKNVPQDLETMDAVWNGIKHLESVKGFVNWLKTNTSMTVPEILKHEITTAVSLSRFSQEDMITQMEFEGGELNSIINQ